MGFGRATQRLYQRRQQECHTLLETVDQVLISQYILFFILFPLKWASNVFSVMCEIVDVSTLAPLNNYVIIIQVRQH